MGVESRASAPSKTTILRKMKRRPTPMKKRLLSALKDAVGVNVTRIAVLDTLSGYFDRK